MSDFPSTETVALNSPSWAAGSSSIVELMDRAIGHGEGPRRQKRKDNDLQKVPSRLL